MTRAVSTVVGGFMRYALIPAGVVLIGSLACSDDQATAPPSGATNSPGGWISATADGEPFISSFVTVRRHDGVIALEGTTWTDAESMLTIRLFIRTDAGPGDQSIGSSSNTAADVMYRPGYAEPQGWTASGPNGSGTLTLSTLTDNRATGTFSFTATAVMLSTSPPTYRVTNGYFDVRF